MENQQIKKQKRQHSATLLCSKLTRRLDVLLCSKLTRRLDVADGVSFGRIALGGCVSLFRCLFSYHHENVLLHHQMNLA